MTNSYFKISDMNEYILTPEEDAEFMANIDMEALERGIRKSEEDIANERVIEFEEAMSQIHREVFGEEFIEKIDTEALDKIIDYYETQMDRKERV